MKKSKRNKLAEKVDQEFERYQIMQKEFWKKFNIEQSQKIKHTSRIGSQYGEEKTFLQKQLNDIWK